MNEDLQSATCAATSTPATASAGAESVGGAASVAVAQTEPQQSTKVEPQNVVGVGTETVNDTQRKRSTCFTMVKAIAIICVVLSHAGISGWLSHFVFIFHVPIFFLCAGYFFHTKYLNDAHSFVMHRVKGLYWPFVRWSVFFLVIHNLLFTCGILSEQPQFGNATMGVLHPYNWTQWSQHLWSIVFNMSGYNDFLCGSFWFFRALFVASLLFLVLFKILRKNSRFAQDKQAGWALLGCGVLLTLWKTTCGIHVTGLAQGGYRELLGLSFMAAGFLLRQYKVMERLTWKVAVPCAVLLLVASFLFPSSMAFNGKTLDFVSIFLPAIAAFIAIAYGCQFIDRRDTFVKRSLVHIGDNTLYIFAFHIVAFKVVSALKVACYGLPWEAVGGHPTVLNPASNVLWVILYLIAGVGLPLLWMAGYRRVQVYVKKGEARGVELLLTAGDYLLKGLEIALKGLLAGLVFLVLNFRKLSVAALKGIGRFFLGIYRGIKQTIKDIMSASSPEDE